MCSMPAAWSSVKWRVERSGRAAAAEMRRHLVEIEKSLMPKDRFAGYREAGAAEPARTTDPRITPA